MGRGGILPASVTLMVALIACVPLGTSDTRRDESVLAIPVPSPGLSIRAERRFWRVVSGTHSVIDNQASVLLKRRDGVGDVFISSPPMISVGTSAHTYHAYVTSLGNMTTSEIVVDGSASSFSFEEWRDKVLCITHVAVLTFSVPFKEKVLFRGSWQKDDVVAAVAVQDVLRSIRPQTEE